ncbi:MAG: peptide deformylase [Clostridia bacterium]
MATRRIVEIGDEKLRKHAKPVEKFDKRLSTLLRDLADTMYKADGVGLAAPQVGILRRAVVVDVGEGLFELVNPEIIQAQGEQTGPEGCLSIPGRSGVVIRPNKVVVKAQDVQGNPIEITGEGFFARALCHELDHLEGVLYVDKMEREIFHDDDEEDDEGEDDDEEEADQKDDCTQGEECP